MEEKTGSLENSTAESEAPDVTKQGAEESGKVTVKFNKEIREITDKEAKNLAQKGLKYEQIENDYIRLKNIAKQENLSVSEYLCGIEKEKASARREKLIEEAGGNESLADYILSLENEKQQANDGFEELNKMFPEIKEIGELPEEVIETSNSTGKNLLDSFLRYLFSKNMQSKTREEEKKAVEKAGIGPLGSGRNSAASAVNQEFIKGLWNR